MGMILEDVHLIIKVHTLLLTFTNYSCMHGWIGLQTATKEKADLLGEDKLTAMTRDVFYPHPIHETGCFEDGCGSTKKSLFHLF